MRKNVVVKLSALLWVFLIVVIFILLSYFVQNNIAFFESLIVGNFFGMLIYILLNILAIVLAPITVFPLIVVATGLWGWLIAVIITAFAWIVGSVIAFIIARKFGVPIVKKFMSLESIYEFEERASIGNNFWSVVFLRMIIPVDVLSYALGLFSKIKLFNYTIATTIGILPFIFLFAYLGKISFIYQIILGLVFLISFLTWLIYREVNNK